jgi:peptidoglycan hydrolase-like protein with peptidoglycan-binding domain
MSIYYPEMLDVLRAAGCAVAENDITDGWQTRARSSGGFPSPPLAVWWHHTASSTSPANDLSWMIDGCDDAPVGNLLLDRYGIFWPVAAGASNCAGKGGPWTFSRGTVPLDSGNTRGWQIECANNGVGERWPQPQIDALFAGSNALNAHVGNLPDDIISHHAWAPDRKIDPATAAAVEGPWRPSSSNGSGTWSLHDMSVECSARAGHAQPTPIPPPTTGVFTVNGYRSDVRQGVTGKMAKMCQQQINLIASQGIVEDGQFGNQSVGALKNVQTVLGVPVDGWCGQQTWQAFEEGINEQAARGEWS